MNGEGIGKSAWLPKKTGHTGLFPKLLDSYNNHHFKKGYLSLKEQVVTVILLNGWKTETPWAEDRVFIFILFFLTC